LEGRVDLWVVSDGERAFLTDIHQADPLLWSESASEELARSGCACDGARNPFAPWQSIVLLLVLLRRRDRP